MRQTIDAILDNGVLRPLEPLPWLPENRPVRVTILIEDQVRDVNDCVGTLPDADADEMRRIIADEFERVNPDDWK
jgi:predicted DNA-binding antitoxin AbrB/MazE fold protein